MRSYWIYLLLIPGVLAINNAPVCTPDVQIIQIAEDAGVASPVTSPPCTDGDTGVDGQISFAFISGNGGGEFQLDTGNGDVTLATNLDYEGATQSFDVKIRVSDGGTPVLETVFSLYVYVTPVNEFPPVISTVNPTVNNLQESKLGVVITTIVATDQDNGKDGELKYSITNGNDEGKFHIDETDGKIYIVQRLDFETTTTYSLTVTVEDQSETTPRSDSTTVTVNLKNVNEFYTVCQPFFSVKVNENAGNNRRNGVLARVGNTCSDIDDDGTRRYSFSFFNRFFNDHTKFNIHPFGNYRLNQKIDPDTEQSVYFQKVSVREYGVYPRFLTDVYVLIEIVGVDDNPTVWTNTDIKLVRPENLNTGSKVYQLVANDGDPVDRNEGRIRYGMDGQTNTGQFAVLPGGEVYLLLPMDRETDTQVVLDVYAFTLNKPATLVRATITIEITDVNDNKPEFDQPWYSVSVTEGVDHSVTPIASVGATDPDLAQNGAVTFTITGGDPDGEFIIDAITGVVTAPTPLDYETHQMYTLTVSAQDGATSPLIETVTLLINVIPVNEFDPVVVGGLTGSISERGTQGSLITRVDANDADSGLDGLLVFTGVNDLYPFGVDSNTGDVTLMSADLDREILSEHLLEILVADSSDSSLRSVTVTVTVTILDENDNAPLCTPVIYSEMSVLDGPGKLVSSVICSDADEGANADLSFTITSGNDRGDITVDASGQIVLVNSPSLDYYRLEIFVEDKGVPALNTLVDVIIKSALLPVALNLDSAKEFPENTSVATILYEINSTLTGTADYSIISGNTDGYFSIGRTSGKLFLAKEFDKEVLDRFDLELVVTDVETGFTTQGNLTITVNDVNDNAPIFNSEFYIRKVVEDLAIGIEIISIPATDADVDPVNRQLTFTVTSGNADGKFNIDNTGKLTLIGALDFETTAEYNLNILVEDNAPYNGLHGKSRLQIHVVNKDEFPATFDFSGSTNPTDIPEDFPLGGTVLQVRANDLDGDSIQYEFVSADNSTYSIDTLTGEIYLIKSLDREVLDMHELVVLARNPVGSSSSATINIRVTDVNDNDPTFSSSVITVGVLESVTSGFSVINISCSDADIGPNADIVYSITSGNSDGHFTLSGLELLTDAALNFYSKSHYSLTIEAKDQGIPSRSSIALVTILVLQESISPKFLPNSDTIMIPENRPPGSPIYNLEATALGAKEYKNGTLRYKFVSGNELSLYTMMEESGEVFLAVPLEADTGITYSPLVIESWSAIDASLTDTFTLYITVTDINDNNPVFTQFQYLSVVPDGSAVGFSVLTVTATDADSGVNAQMSYTLRGAGSTDFAIDPTSGELNVANTINYDVKERYILTVDVTDSGVPALTAEAIIILTVERIQNNPPVFFPTSASTDIAEDIAVATEIYKVIAIDTDSGVNGVLAYTIVGGNLNGHFSLSADGIVTVTTVLDRETIDSYLLEIECSDSGSPSLSATITLAVSVLDVNDNVPTFSQASYTFIVSKDVQTGYQFGSVAATDTDLDYNSVVQYSIQSGNSGGYFKVDPNTGILTTSAGLSVAVGPHTLVVRAIDLGVSPQSNTVAVSINVIASPTYVFNVIENAASVSVGTVTEPGSVSLSIVAGDVLGEFNMDINTGEITTVVPLDREITAQYSLTVHVEETANPASWYNVLVTVNVDDDNDNDPQFTYPSYSVEILEGSPADFKVFHLPVTDHDFGPNADLTLTIVDAASDAIFKISPLTNHLLVKVPPVLSDSAFYDVRVRAVDSGSPARTAESVVRVDILQSALAPLTSDSTGGDQSMYLSLECSHTDPAGRVLATISMDMFGFSSADVSSVNYFTLQTDKSPFTVDDSTGEIKISNADLVHAESKYIFWVVINAVMTNGTQESRQGLVRVDTFDPQSNIIKVNLDLSVTSIAANGEPDGVLAVLQTLVPTARLSVWKTDDAASSGVTSRRKLLASATSTVFVYGILSPISDSLVVLPDTKQFITAAALLALLQSNPDGTPVLGVNSGPTTVISVLGIDIEPIIAQAWQETTNGIAIIAIICIFLFLLVAALLIYFICTRAIIKKTRSQDGNQKQGAMPSSCDIADDDTMAKDMYRSSRSPPPPYQSRPGTAVDRVKIIEGVAYDGSGIDPDTGARYYFNSKTGQTYGRSGYNLDERTLANTAAPLPNKHKAARGSTVSEIGSVDSFASTEILFGPPITEDANTEKTVRSTLPVGLRVPSHTPIGSAAENNSFTVPPGSPSFHRSQESSF